MQRKYLEEKIGRYLKAATNAVKDAQSTENCRDVPKILAIASQNVGRAQVAFDAIEAGQLGRKTRQFANAIRTVDKKVHATVSGYAHGPCVRRTAYDK